MALKILIKVNERTEGVILLKRKFKKFLKKRVVPGTLSAVMLFNMTAIVSALNKVTLTV